MVLLYTSNIMTQIVLPVPALTYEEIKAIALNELKKYSDLYYCTIRGLARLIGISSSTLTDGRKLKSGKPMGILRRIAECSEIDLPESLKHLAGFDYRLSEGIESPNSETGLLPLEVVQAVIKYYAYEAQKPHARAKQLDSMFSTIGAYAFFDKIISGDNLSTAEPLNHVGQGAAIEMELATYDTPVDRALELIHKLESYRLRREEIVCFMDQLGMLTSDNIRNSTYRGVQKHKNSWKAFISVDGVTRYIGCYKTPEEAARAYDSYAKVIHGDKAKLNF